MTHASTIMIERETRFADLAILVFSVEAKKPSALARSLSRRSHPAGEEEVSGCRCVIM